MLTEDQVFLNIFEVENNNRFYKFYKYTLGGEETFDKKDMELYEIDSLSVCGKDEWLDLSALKVFSNIRALVLYNYCYTSIDVLQEFTNLEYLRILNLCDSVIPFNKFQKLYSAEVNYDHKTCKLLFDSRNIEFLRLYNYKQKSATDLTKLKKLKKLSLEQCKLENLDFLEHLPRLHSFRIAYDRNLKSIVGLTKAIYIKEIEIINCKKIEDWDSLSRAYHLKVVFLEDCGEINSITFLESLQNLKVLRIVGNTKIKDGLLKSIVEKESIEYAKIVLYDHYDITQDDLDKFSWVNYPEVIMKEVNLYQSEETEFKIEGINLLQSLQSIEEKYQNTKYFSLEEFQKEIKFIKDGMGEYLSLDLDENPEKDLLPQNYTLKDIQSFEKIMNEFYKELEDTQGIEEIVLYITKQTILKLNQLNTTCGGVLIETKQREEIVTLILDVIETFGIEVDSDITLSWRDW